MSFHQAGLMHSTYLCMCFSFLLVCFFVLSSFFFLLLFFKVCRNSEPLLLEGELLPISHVPELSAQGIPQPRGNPAYLGLPGTVSSPYEEHMEGVSGQDASIIRLFRGLMLGSLEFSVLVD